MNLNEMKDSQRLLMEADLWPLQGHEFQPTGFPELGPATFYLPDGTEMLKVESPQSMANRLEHPCWDEGKDDLVDVLEGMPYIRVWHEDRVLTNSIMESHRLNSPYILHSDFFDTLRQELKIPEDGPVDYHTLAEIAWKYDPNSLVHGLFLARSKIAGGRFRIPRLLSAFIEAENVQPVESGGVKIDRVNPSANAQEGFGNVPFARTEYTASSITAYFNLDLSLLRGYRLGETAENFLTTLCLWKIRSFLDEGLRLRTACDLKCNNIRAIMPVGFELPSKEALENEIPGLIQSAEGFAEPRITEVTFNPPQKWKKKQSEENNPEGGAAE